MTRGTFLLVLFFLTPGLGARGEDFLLPVERGLSLAAAVEMALENSFSVRAESARLTSWRERHGAAKAESRPQVSAALRATEFQHPMVISPIHGFTADVTPTLDKTLFQGALDLSFSLYDGGARRSSVRQSEAQMGAAGHSVVDTQQGVVAEIIHIYLQILGNEEILQAHDWRLEALRSEAARVEDQFSVGRVAEVEVLRIAAAVAEAEAERILLAADQETAERSLARSLGLDHGRVPAIALRAVALRDQDLVSRNDLYGQAMSTNAAILRARALLRASEAKIEFARSTRMPKLTALGNITDYGSAEGEFGAEWWVGLKLAMPLYTGGRSAREIGGAEAERNEAAARLREAERRLAESVDRTATTWQATIARETSLSAAVRGLAAVAEVERQRLESGAGTPADFLDAQADLLNGKAGLTLARNATILARVELARTLGELDASWIADVLQETPIRS